MGLIKAQDGFSLIQLAIVLTVAGVLISGFLQLYKIEEKRRLMAKTDYAIFTVTDSLSKYLSRNGRYPCPARTDRSASDEDYGEETDCTDMASVDGDTCGDGYCVATQSGKRIRIGMLPFKDLDIGREDIIDAYKNRFTYVVTEQQATASYVEGDGVIQLLDIDDSTGGAITQNNLDMLFFSHGENGAGATRSSGVAAANQCDQAGMDEENCDLDGVFISDERAKSNLATGTYDDKLVYNIWSWIYIWDEAGDDINSIYNRDIGNMGIGTEQPSEKLHVAAGNLKVEEADMQTISICNDDGENCFEASDLGGAGMGCGNGGMFMIGIAERNSLCTSVLGGATGNCGAGENFVSGFTFSEDGVMETISCRNALTDADSGTYPVTNPE